MKNIVINCKQNTIRQKKIMYIKKGKKNVYLAVNFICANNIISQIILIPAPIGGGIRIIILRIFDTGIFAKQ